MAILWPRKLEQYVKPVELGLDWCAAIEVSVGHRRFYIINVYMPYQCPENEEKYLDSLGAIHAIVTELDSTCYAIMGDWNPNLSNTANSVFAQHMINFCSDNDLAMSSSKLLPTDSYTFVSESWGTTSWLGHVVGSKDFHESIENMFIHYEITDVDHIPISVDMDIQLLPELSSDTTQMTAALG